MTSHGTIQGYNCQALVDAKHQIIVQAEASGDGQDHHHIPPLIDSAKETMQALEHGEDYFEGTIFTADSNYHSEENLRNVKKSNWKLTYLTETLEHGILALPRRSAIDPQKTKNLPRMTLPTTKLITPIGVLKAKLLDAK